MQAFEELLSCVDRLLGPNGCPWDQKQTLSTVKNDILEESCELIDAIDQNNKTHIIEELGDVAFLVLFFGRLAEKQGLGTLKEALELITQKLIRRHPHVFADTKIHNSDHVLTQWDEIKSKEPGKAERKSALDRIPKSLPSLARAHEVLQKIRKREPEAIAASPLELEIQSEDELGDILFSLVVEADKKGFHAENALRKRLNIQEDRFRAIEKV